MDFFDFLISRWYLSLPLVVTLILWWMYESNKGGKKIGPSEAVDLINADKAIFVDIRERDAFEKISMGASLLQLYTSLIYQGPNVVVKILSDLSCSLKRKGLKNVSDLIGKNIKYD